MQRAAWDAVALALFSLAMAGALLLLVVSLFWSGWVLAGLLVPVGLLVWRLVMQNRFWHVARLVEERFPEVRGRLVAAIQLAYWAKTGTVPRAERSGGLSPVFARAGMMPEVVATAEMPRLVMPTVEVHALRTMAMSCTARNVY